MGVLAGVEWIGVDFASPVEAVATVSSALEPLVRKHAERQRAQELQEERTKELLLVIVAVAAMLLIANGK